MRKIDNKILFSATDLMRFMGCTHATALDLLRLRGEGPTPGEDTEEAALLQKQGDAHELAHLERLKAAGNRVVEIERGNIAQDSETTRAALQTGAEVVFQGAFLSGNWGGWEKRAKVGDALRGGISWRCLSAVNSQPRKGYATCRKIPSPPCLIHPDFLRTL